MKPGESITTFVDGVIDSSRYYVLRIKDPKSSRTTLIGNEMHLVSYDLSNLFGVLGIGFRERETAFDFKSALNEYIKYVDRLHLAQKLSASSDNQDEKNEEVTYALHYTTVVTLINYSVKQLNQCSFIWRRFNILTNTLHH